mmetsp:Transcript_28834/g.67132  ORF Transcript_28834/g.67132 Transcript_28834/m.67132 type:complete len:225 (-) Transcript_28834:3-677(-)
MLYELHDEIIVNPVCRCTHDIINHLGPVLMVRREHRHSLLQILSTGLITGPPRVYFRVVIRHLEAVLQPAPADVVWGFPWQVDAMAARKIVHAPSGVDCGTHEHQLQIRSCALDQVTENQHGEVSQDIPLMDLVYEDAGYSFQRGIAHHRSKQDASCAIEHPSFTGGHCFEANFVSHQSANWSTALQRHPLCKRNRGNPSRLAANNPIRHIRIKVLAPLMACNW